jgi:transcriptional regulator with XRE-family HTH domain
MRAAREAAGISLREMARQMGYHSHTTLSAYECGAVMPTDEAVTAYEQILSLDPGTLTVILEHARIERHGDAWAKRRVRIPSEIIPRNQETGRLDANRFQRHPYYATCAILMSISDSNSDGDRYPSAFCIRLRL